MTKIANSSNIVLNPMIEMGSKQKEFMQNKRINKMQEIEKANMFLLRKLQKVNSEYGQNN